MITALVMTNSETGAVYSFGGTENGTVVTIDSPFASQELGLAVWGRIENYVHTGWHCDKADVTHNSTLKNMSSLIFRRADIEGDRLFATTTEFTADSTGVYFSGGAAAYNDLYFKSLLLTFGGFLCEICGGNIVRGFLLGGLLGILPLAESFQFLLGGHILFCAVKTLLDNIVKLLLGKGLFGRGAFRGLGGFSFLRCSFLRCSIGFRCSRCGFFHKKFLLLGRVDRYFRSQFYAVRTFWATITVDS